MLALPKLPQNPGCYLMKDKSGVIIYIGKAKNIRKRVSQYFQNKNHDPKTQELVCHITDIDFFVTATEVEALLLEAKLIRQHKPKYNIDLKNSDRYAYIKLTNEEFPRIMTVRQKDKDGELFGPYTDGTARRQVVHFIQKRFKIRTCKVMPKRVCLLYHIGRCSGPCEEKIDKPSYLANVQKARMYLKGNISDLKKELSLEMQNASKELNFERARDLRDTLASLEHLSGRQRMDLQKKYDQDIINLAEKENKILIQLFHLSKGTVLNKAEFIFDKSEDVLESFVKQFYAQHTIPSEIILPRKLVDHEIIVEYLVQTAGKKVMLTIPEKGDKKKLLELVGKNAQLHIDYKDTGSENLKEKLGLQTSPQVIECFDISNLGETACVGSVVQFRQGRPDKSNYRRFKIKTVKGQDDFSMIAEIVTRRYKRLQTEGAQLPDLIVIDGGLGQLGAAKKVLDDLGVFVPVISLAKQFEEIHFPNKDAPLQLGEKSEGRKLLQRIRDEAHRFGLKYHRLLRSKKMKD